MIRTYNPVLKHSIAESEYPVFGVINTFSIAAGVPWLAAFIWAIWPTNKSLIDPIAGNVTGKGNRNSGDTVGSIEYGRERGYLEEKNK